MLFDASRVSRRVTSAEAAVWLGRAAGALSYALQVSTDSLFGGGFAVNLTGLADTQRTVTGLAAMLAHDTGVLAATTAFVSPAVNATLIPATVMLPVTVAAAKVTVSFRLMFPRMATSTPPT